MWVDAIRPHVGGLAAASIMSGAANLLFRSLPNSRKIVEGVPLYLFFVAMLFQLFVYPHFAWSAWRFTGYDERWFSQGWGSDPMGDATSREQTESETMLACPVFGVALPRRAWHAASSRGGC